MWRESSKKAINRTESVEAAGSGSVEEGSMDAEKQITGEELRALRTRKKVTIGELSQQFGVSRSTICSFEKGRQNSTRDASLMVEYLNNLEDMPKNMDAVAKNLRRIRRQKHMSQKELAKKSGMTKDWIVKLETGQLQKRNCEIKRDSLRFLTGALGVTFAEIGQEEQP